MTPVLALQTFLICFNGQLYSTEKEVVYSNNTKIGLVEIKDAVDLETECNPDEVEYHNYDKNGDLKYHFNDNKKAKGTK